MPLKNDEIDISFHLFLLEGPVPEFEKNIKNVNIKGSFNNYIDKMRGEGRNCLTHATKTSQKSSKCCSDIKYYLHQIETGSNVFS